VRLAVVRVHKSAPTGEKVAALEEGKVYEVRIDDMGKKGDGIARHDKYTIFVPGVTKGMIIKIKIEKIAGTIAYARVTE
jgi:translation initiation factor 2 subunit 2